MWTGDSRPKVLVAGTGWTCRPYCAMTSSAAPCLTAQWQSLAARAWRHAFMTACLHVHKSHGQNHGCRHGHRHECGQSQGLHHTGSAQEAQWHCWRRLPSSLSTCRELLTEAPHTSSVQCSRVDGLDARVASDHLGWVIASMLGAHLHLHYSKHPRSIWSSSLCQWPQRPLWRSPHLRIVAGATGHRLRTCPLPRRRQQACSIWQCAGCPVCSAGQASLLTLKVSPLLTTILGAAPVVGM